MFTGIVEAVGRVVGCERAPQGVHLRVDVGALDVRDVGVGDSVAVAGCCLTVVATVPPLLHFDVSDETLGCTKGFAINDAVNLEKALRLSDRLGGHLMSGHVDGVAIVTAFDAASTEQASHRRLEAEVPPTLARYIVAKGSVALDGVSLTTNVATGVRFTVNLIPHTLAATTLGSLRAGHPVNLEVDMVARYVERLRGVE